MKNNKQHESKTDQIFRDMGSPLPEAFEGEEAARYFIETLSECNLKCGLCAFGSREIFERKKGIMDIELFKQIVNKIATKSPHAVVSPYHHSEPMLHPQLPEMIKVIKRHGLKCAIATNFNSSINLKEILEAGVDELSISVSGFYQEIYQKSHVNGNIEKVKENLLHLRNLIDDMRTSPSVSINYHMYKDNLGDDFDKMEDFCKELKFTFAPSWARSISVEMTLKYLRENGLSTYHGETLPWYDEIPALTKRYYENIDRVIYLPEDYLMGSFKDVHGDECPMNYRDINIRWNGTLSFCCAAFDDRFMTSDYLTTPIESLYEMRRQSPLCKECLGNNFAFYSNYLDMEEIDKRAAARLDINIPDNRRFFANSDSRFNDMYKFCNEHDNIFIFGAGDYGQRVADILSKKSMKYNCFIVSESHITKYESSNIKPVSYLLNGHFDNAGIIIALDSKNTDEVYDTLKKTGIALCLAVKYL